MENLQTGWQGLIFMACLAQGIYTDRWVQGIITDCLAQRQYGTEDNYRLFGTETVWHRPIGNKGYIQRVGTRYTEKLCGKGDIKDCFANQGYVKAVWLTGDTLQMFDQGNSYRRMSRGNPYRLFDSGDNYRLISTEHTYTLFGKGDIYILYIFTLFHTGDI